ncbi:MAG TPA: NlpC/P60 family protein [Actinocrinis sp.]|nr:NlpC/P60 family protein [Actinocrinis sp.]
MTAGTVALMPGTSQASPTQSLSQVKAEVASLNQQAEVAGQQFDAAQEQYAALQKKVDGLQGQIVHEQSALDSLENTMGLQAAAQYRNGGISPTLQLALNSSPEKYLSQAGIENQQAAQEAMLMKSITQEKAQLALDKKAAATALAEEQQLVAQAAKHKADVASTLTKEQSLLSTLTAQQRATVVTAGVSTSRYSGALPSVSGRAAAAVAYVKSKVGDPYVYGDTGPGAFDCSGLIYAAYAYAGMSIPRTSEEQAAAATSISASDLQPGDVIYFYGYPPSHIGMYVGNGMFIDARNSNVGVVWGSLDPSSKYYSYMPVSGYGRF